MNDLAPYGEQLRAFHGSGHWSVERESGQYDGPGSYPLQSPDGRYVAATETWGGLPGALLGFAIERPFIHTVGLRDEQTRQYLRIVSIMEADPHSGFAHRYSWSADSKALLIYGSGRLADDYERIMSLCMVYLPETGALYRVAKCPELDLVVGATTPQNKELKLTKPGKLRRFAA